MVVTKRSSTSAVRPSKLAKFSPDAKFVVWSRAAYPRDGFHSYEGPGERDVLAVFEDKAEANEAAKRFFYKKNPWGLSVDEVEEPEARMKNGMLYLMIHPDDSEVWEVCVADREQFERKEEERQAAYDRDEEFESDYEEDDSELYGNITKVAINPEDYLDGSGEDEEDEDDEGVHTGGVQLLDIAGGLAAAQEDDEDEDEYSSEGEDEDEFTSEDDDSEDFDEEEDLSEEDEEDFSEEEEDDE